MKQFYKNINEIPIANFIECTKGHYQYLYKNDFFELENVKPKEDFEDIFLDILDQKEDVNINIPRMAYLIILNYSKYVTDGKMKNLEKAETLKKEYERLTKTNDKFNFLDEVSTLEIFMKREIDIYKVSAAKYFAYRKNYIKYIAK